jgi:hypothetical protein
MVVVGGRSSANTRELTRLCEIAGTPALQIESVSDITDPAVFGDAAIVGVTGGTSTPIEDLRDVAERILAFAGTPDARPGRRGWPAAFALAATPAGRTTSLPSVRPDGGRQDPRRRVESSGRWLTERRLGPRRGS